MSRRKSYLDKMENQIREWEQEIDRLMSEARKEKKVVKAEYENLIEKINTRKSEALTRLNELKNSGEDAWEELKQGYENSWKELRSSIERAKARLK